MQFAAARISDKCVYVMYRKVSKIQVNIRRDFVPISENLCTQLGIPVSDSIDIVLQSGSSQRVFQQHCNGHGTNTSRYRCYCRCYVYCGGIVHITDQLIIQPVDADINHDCSRLNHVGRDKVGLADGRDQNICLTGNFGEVSCATVGDRDSGVGDIPLLDEQRGHRLADDFAAPEDHGVGSVDLGSTGGEQFLAAVRCAGKKAGTPLYHQPDVFRVKAVHILEWSDSIKNGRLVNVFWERQLNQNSVNGSIEIQLLNQCQ